QANERRVVGIEVGTDGGKDARRPPAGALDLTALAGEPVHVGRRAAQIGDHPREPRGVIANLLDLADHGILGAALDDPALVLGDGAEGAAAETAALDGHGEAN